MSINLKVRLTRALDINVLLPMIETALSEVLHVPTIPVVMAREYHNGSWLPLSSKELDSLSPIVGFSVAGEDGLVSASIYKRREEHFTEEDWVKDELGDVISLEACDPNAPIVLALLAAVAIAIGRACGSLIIDDLPFYTNNFDSLPDDFAKAVEINGKYGNYNLAAIEFAKQFVRIEH